MKSLLIFLILSFCMIESMMAQEKKKAEGFDDPQNISVQTSQEPFFPAGDRALYTLVFNSVTYSEEAKKAGLNGEVELSFDVNPDSTVSNVLIMAGPGMGVNEQVKSIVEQLKFAPAIQSGVKTRMNVMMNFPVRAH